MKNNFFEQIRILLWDTLFCSNVSWDKIQKIACNKKLDYNDIDYFKSIKTLGWAELHKIINSTSNGPSTLSFSQSGEDVVFKSLVRNKKTGFFVDVGAHHPVRFSNTFSLYLDGWRGINIDPNPGVKCLFDSIRPEDINLEIAVGKSESKVFYQFSEAAYNTFDHAIADCLIKKNISKLVTKNKTEKIPLADILDKYLPFGSVIDLLSVDAEGLDVEILSSNDWEKYRPLFICAESHTTDDTRPMNPKPVLENNGYKLAAQTEFSAIYSRQD